MEPLLGMPDGWLPRDSAQLDTYMRDMLAGGRVAVTDTSRTLARAVLFPPQWYVVLAGVSGDAADHDRIASALDPPGLRVRVARARRAGVRALDGAAPNIAAAASGACSRVADGEACNRAKGWSTPRTEHCRSNRQVMRGGPRIGN